MGHQNVARSSVGTQVSLLPEEGHELNSSLSLGEGSQAEQRNVHNQQGKPREQLYLAEGKNNCQRGMMVRVSD